MSDSFLEAFPSLLAEFAGRSERLFQRILHVLSDGGLASVDPLCFRDGSAKDGLTARQGVFAVGLIQGDQVKKPDGYLPVWLFCASIWILLEFFVRRVEFDSLEHDLPVNERKEELLQQPVA